MPQGCRRRWPPSIRIGPDIHPDATLTASVPSLTAVPESDRAPSGMVGVAGLSFLLKAGGGLYWMIPAVLASLFGGVVNAWLFLLKVDG